MPTYDIYTDLDPETLTSVAIETYTQWLLFALGKQALGGRFLKNPSGRYAATLSWKRTGEFTVEIFTTDTDPISDWIEEGTSGTSNLKEQMLTGGKIGKDGGRYRDIPIRADTPSRYGGTPDVSAVSDDTLSKAALTGGLPQNLKFLWSRPRPLVDPKRWVRMSDANPSAWIIPPMVAYSPAAILKDLIERAAAHG